MNKGLCSAVGIIILLFVALFSCAPKPFGGISDDSTITCIQGKVSYKNPIDGSSTPYPGATVSAWQQGAEKPLSDARTNQIGLYCIEVPVGDFKMELRVWGSVLLGGTTYICQGLEGDINQGEAFISCGGDCKVVDIITECKERIPSRRR